jgi:aminoglycoside phosphotransferase
MAQDLAALLPHGLADQVEAAAGASIVAVTPRGGGGSSRQGAELLLRDGDGREQRAYINYDALKAGVGDDAAFLREAAVLRALCGPLKGAGVRTAPFIAAIPESRALVVGFVEGDALFAAGAPEEARRQVDCDLMVQLARLHAIDIDDAPVEGMGEIRPPSRMIAERLAFLRARNHARGDDALISLALNWLEANIPPDPERIVIVHGDAGPANFLFRDGRVTALLDWELVHYGDPMADLAMLCIRNLFQPFMPLAEAFATYEAAGGARVDLDRVRFWRLFFETGFSGGRRDADPNAPAPPLLGMSMVYTAIHRRALTEALAEAMGTALPEANMPDAPPGAHQRTYDIALDDLKESIVPRLADQHAAAKAKALSRLVKWWRDVARYGPGFEAVELAELSEAMGRAFSDLAQARQAFSSAMLAKSIDQLTALRLCHAPTSRDVRLLADAMSYLADTRFAPLT